YDKQKKSHGSHSRTSENKGKRFSPKIGEHDFQVKARHVYEFLHEGNKVRASVWFRGREMAYPRAGEHLLARLADIVADVGIVERPPLMEGRNMIMILTPKKGKRQSLTMSNAKTHQGTAKRIGITARGKLTRGRQMAGHPRVGKSLKRRRPRKR